MSLPDHRDSEPGYIAFLVNFLEPMVQLPIEIVPGLFFRRATTDEKEVFHLYDEAAHLDRGDSRISRIRISLMTDAVKTETNDDFRGYVFQFGLRQWATYGRDPRSIYDVVELACSISESGLRPVLVCAVGSSLEPYHFTHNLHRHTVLRKRALGSFLKKISKFTADDVAEIRNLSDCIKNLSRDHSFVLEAIDRFKQIELIAVESDFHTFGLFTIVEYLLTHRPANRSRTDSLTKQIVAKAPLIAAMFEDPVSAQSFFGVVSEKEAWKILYDYRSAIAHGRRVDFRKDFDAGGHLELKDRNQIESFLHLFTRRLLKCALRDPERMSALKEQ